MTLLHRENILHRDICPRNVILDNSRGETLRPVLIDFGFARVASKPMMTAMAGEHFAPEVRGLKPFWSKAADVFGLASTLRWVLNPNGLQTGLLRVLERATAERAEDRMSAEQLLIELEQLSEQTKLEQRKEIVWRDIQKSLSPAERHSPWFMPLLRKSQSTLVGLAMGFHRNPLDRFRSIAEFLNRTVESCPAPRMSLNTIQARLQGQDVEAIEMVRALRNDTAHGERAMYEQTRRLIEQFTRLSADGQRQMFRRAIASVSRATKVTSLKGLLEKHL